MLEEYTTDHKTFAHITTKFFVIKQLTMMISFSMVALLAYDLQWVAYLSMLVLVVAALFIRHRYIAFDTPKNLIFNNKMVEA